MAHLMRRAGFGASRERLDELVAQGYDEVVEGLLDAVERPTRFTDNLVRRYHPEYSGMMGNQSAGANWMYRMVSTDAPLREKVGLMWHGIFATGYSKLANGKVLNDQIRMFERHGMGSFRTLLIELSKDPAMIVWLDNWENHDGAINENYGRELLELFSMGVGNYSEQDVKEAARAFTGWTIANTEYMTLKSMRDSVWPYGRLSFHFEYKEDDHDDGEKEFLGHKGNFNGDDIVDIICKQPATAAFLSRHVYSFFVADEPPVPEQVPTRATSLPWTPAAVRRCGTSRPEVTSAPTPWGLRWMAISVWRSRVDARFSFLVWSDIHAAHNPSAARWSGRKLGSRSKRQQIAHEVPGERSADHRISFESALNSFVPATRSQSKAMDSVVVCTAPARTHRSMPACRWSSRREHTPSMGTCTSIPDATRSRTV